MVYRNATLEDLPIIVEIYNSTIGSREVTADTDPVSVADKLSWFHEHNPNTRPLWMIENENEIIGWVSFQDFYGRPAYDVTAELSLYLKEQHRNQGIGKRVVQYAISKCSQLGINNLLGFVFEQNKNSLKMVSSLGFEEWGHLKNIAILDGKYCSLKIMGLKVSEK